MWTAAFGETWQPRFSAPERYASCAKKPASKSKRKASRSLTQRKLATSGDLRPRTAWARGPSAGICVDLKDLGAHRHSLAGGTGFSPIAPLAARVFFLSKSGDSAVQSCNPRRRRAQQRGCLVHRNRNVTASAAQLNNVVKDRPQLAHGAGINLSGEGDHAFAMSSSQSCDPERRLALQSLPVEAALARQYKVGPGHGVFEADGGGDDLEPRPDFRRAQRQQAKAEATRSPRTRGVPVVDSNGGGDDVGEVGQRLFKRFSVLDARQSLLGAVPGCGSGVAQQRAAYIAGDDDLCRV